MYKTKQKINSTISGIAKVLVSLVFIFPFVWMISIALQTKSETNTLPITFIPTSPQFVNFITAWNRAPFGTYLKNTIIIVITIFAMQMIIMIPAAYAFAKMNFRGKNVLFTLVLIAFMMPVQITFLPIYYMMSDMGLMDTLWPQIIPWMTSGFGIFLLRQYFMQVPNELIEAAQLDDANEVQILAKIMIPMSKPGLSAIALFSFVTHWNDYFWPLVMTRSELVRPLTVGISRLKDTEGDFEWNIIMAGNMLLVMPVLIVYLFASKIIIRSFAYSGIK